MSAIARLVSLYFTANPLCRGLALLGFALMLAGMTGYLVYPAWTLGAGRSDLPLWYQAAVASAPSLGLMLLLFSTSNLPGIVERLLVGRAVYVLAGSRLYVLLSVLLTANLIALLLAVSMELFFSGFPSEIRPPQLFFRTWIVTFSNTGLIYAALWIVAKTRGIWLLLGSLLIAIGFVTPLVGITRPSGIGPWPLVGFAVWAAFAVFALLGGRLRHAARGAATRWQRRAREILPRVPYSAGSELDLLLGTARPWVVAIGQAVPVAVAGWLIFDLRAWLFFLTLFMAIGGAITSTAAARSRVLWLKLGWTREEMFRRVEAAYWRYNAYPLGVMLLLFVAFGAYRELSTPVLSLGLALLVLGSLVSLYLGLMMTRGLRWLEIVLGIGTMGLLIFAAIAVVQADERMTRAIELQVALALLVPTYRFWAKGRWLNLDWLVCRDPALTRGAG
jgi:hypothetical protein